MLNDFPKNSANRGFLGGDSEHPVVEYQHKITVSLLVCTCHQNAHSLERRKPLFLLRNLLMRTDEQTARQQEVTARMWCTREYEGVKPGHLGPRIVDNQFGELPSLETEYEFTEEITSYVVADLLPPKVSVLMPEELHNSLITVSPFD